MSKTNTIPDDARLLMKEPLSIQEALAIIYVLDGPGSVDEKNDYALARAKVVVAVGARRAMDRLNQHAADEKELEAMKADQSQSTA
jgi:hypothetical protein